MNYQFIKTYTKEGVLQLVLARSEKRNAFNPQMLRELQEVIDWANSNDEVRVVTISAEGPVFCAGMDLKAFSESEELSHLPSLGEIIEKLNKPSIALVEGNVIAGGFLIILECTYVLAASHVTFKLPEVHLGLFPFQVLNGLQKIMPLKKAIQLCIGSEAFDWQKAHDLGLVDGGIESIDTLIKLLLKAAPNAVKSGIKAAKELPHIEPSQRYKYLVNCLNNLRVSDEAQEGISALFEKRAPSWQPQ